MYTIACFTVLFITIADYSKNSKCYKETKLEIHKNFKEGRKRVISLFNIGFTLFNRAFNSLKYIRISFSFTIYGI